MPRLMLYLLGPPRLERDGELIQVSRRKAVALIAYLAVTGGHHSRDTLATLLWPEYDQSRARADLRRTLSVLNRTLGEGWLTADRETAGLNPDADLWLDVDQFRQRLSACETHGHPVTEICPDCVPLLEEAAALYHDDFLAGFTLRDSLAFDEWQFFQTEGLRDELANALERLARWHSDRGEYEPASAYARRWLGLDPLHEPAHRHLMALYARAGRRTAALRQYRACMRVLEEELGVPPSAETTALYGRIRAERLVREEKEAAAPTPTPPHPPTPHPPAFLSREEEPAALERPVFVARERELARLDGYLDTALASQGRVVFVTGGPGRGKTALMREFARRAMEAHPDLLVAQGNCNAYSGVGDPYLPFREVMGMLTGDVEARWVAGAISREHARRLWAVLPLALQALVECGPSLIDTVVPGPVLLSRAAVAAPDGPGWLGQLKALVERERSGHSDLQQSALFEQFTNVLRALAKAHPLLLLLDDVQWADTGSISLLFHLGRRLEGCRVLIACAYRPEEVALERDGEHHPLESALSEFKRRFGDVWVDLTRADEPQGRRFVDAFLDTEPNRLGEDFRLGVFQRTGGHPLFTIELLRAMQERGDLVQDDVGAWVEGSALNWETLPARVEAVIEERVGRLDEELRDVLAVASVEGERFTAQVVAQVQDIPEREMLRALSQELQARHRLVREGGEAQVGGRFLSRYQFAHALFQQYLYNGLSVGERRLLHGEIAVALEGLYGGQTDEIAVQLAYHYDEAGQGEKAVEYLLRAGDQARLAYANEEAIAHFHRALELLDDARLAQSRGEWRLEALKGLGQTYFGMGKVDEAEESLQEAIALGQGMGLAPRELVRLYYWLGEVLWWQSRHDDRLRVGEEGLALLGDDTESVEAALMNQTIAAGTGANEERFREFTYRTAQFIQRLPYVEELRPAYSHIVLAYSNDRDIEEAMKWLQILEEKAAPHHDLRASVEVHLYTGMIFAQIGDLHGAISRYQQGLELCTRIGDAKGENWCLMNTIDTFLSLGDLRRAEEHASEALEAVKAMGNKRDIAWGFCHVGLLLCQGDWEEAAGAFEKAFQLYQEIDSRCGMAWASYLLGRAHLAQGDRVEALKRFQEGLALVGPEGLTSPFPPLPLAFPFILSGLEAAHADPTVFHAFCRRCREERPEISDSLFVQWYLEPTDVRMFDQTPLHHDAFATSLSPDWEWQDNFGDCSFTVQNGLEIHAANGRDLWHVNRSAPRILRPVSRNLAVQTVCVPVSGEGPAIGGLLLWKDRENYLRLDRGTAGEDEIFFGGCLGNQDVVIGRGCLPLNASGRVFLRLERLGDQVNALCSADGERWFTVGHVPFPVEDPVQVGLHAIGNIDRTIYHGAYPDGTAVRFESFRLWGM